MLKGNTLVLPVDRLLDRAGNGHAYQIRTLILFCVQWLFASIIFYGRRFFFIQPDIYCYQPTATGGTETSWICKEEVACSGEYSYYFDPEGVSSLVSSFDLICERKYLVDLCAAAFFLGSAVGAYYYTEVQQRKGRLFTLIQTTSLVGVVMMASILSIHIYINVAALFMAGFALFGYMNSSIVYYVETSSENLRVIGPNLFLVAWAMGQILLSTVLKHVNDWRPLSFYIMGLPLVISAFFFRFMKESPRFLVLQERFEEAKISIHNIAKINMRPLSDFSFENEMRLGRFNANFFYHDKGPADEKKRPKTIMTLCKYPSLRNATWTLLACWIFITIANHGTVLALKHFNDTPQESLLTVGVVEMFGYILAGYCCLNFRRKTILKTTFVITGMVYILLALDGVRPGDIDIDTAGGMNVFLLVVGRGSVCVAIGTMYIFITEVYPTSVRHFGLGFFMSMAYMALIFMMNLIEPMRSIGLRPSLIVGIVNVGLVYFMKYVPETQKQKLVDYIKEEDDMLLNMELV